MTKQILLLASIFIFSAVSAQTTITWEDLRNVKFEEKYNEEMGMYIQFPTFGESLKKLDGKQVKISGYVIPLDMETGLYVVSANPYASCFFCGGGGPESVMTLNFKDKPKRFNTDERAVFVGKFQLNDSDIYNLNYIMSEAKQVKE